MASDESAPADRLREATRVTAAAGAARLTQEISFWGALSDSPLAKKWRRRRMRPRARALLDRSLSETSKLASRFGSFSQDGCVDLSARRYMLTGDYQVLVDGRQRFSGPPGRWHEDPDHGPSATQDPFWPIELVAGTVEAEEQGKEDVRGAACRHYAAKSDLSRASAESSYGMAPPPIDRFEDLLRLPFEIWVDRAGRIRRIRVHLSHLRVELELYDFGKAEISSPAPQEVVGNGS